MSLSVSVCVSFSCLPSIHTHTQLFTYIIIFLREMIVLKRQTPKLPSGMYNQNLLHYNRYSNNIADVIILCCLHVVTHGCSWWIIAVLVVPVLLAVIAAFYLLY